MVILRNQSKYPTWLLKAILEKLIEQAGYKKPLVVRVHDNFTGQAGEAHQGPKIHTIELEAPFAHTASVMSFVRTFFHELGHVRDYDYDSERKMLKWTSTKDRERIAWKDRPDEIRAIIFADWHFNRIDEMADAMLSVLRRKGETLYAKGVSN